MEVRRDRTAIARSDLSRPVQLLIGNGVLTPKHTFFDYGCGLGDDVRFLQSLGYAAHGWDPAHRQDEARRSAEVVNLGYVLNVIERPGERAEALRRAFELSQKCLCVAVLVGSASYAGEAQTYGDGLLTSRSTFQKYYQQEEVGQYLEEVLGVAPIPLEAGVFLIFRHSADAHAFLLNRLQRSVPLIQGFPRERKRVLRTALMSTFQTQHPEEWAAYADFVSARGRPPGAGELDALRVAAENGLAPADLWEAASGVLPEQQLAEQRRRRTNQYLVFMAISRFRGVPKMGDLPVTSRLDIRYYFRSYSNLKQLSDEHLFAAGDEDRVARLCEAAPVGGEHLRRLLRRPARSAVARSDLADLRSSRRVVLRRSRPHRRDQDPQDLASALAVRAERRAGDDSALEVTGEDRLADAAGAVLRSLHQRGAGTARGKAAPRLR